MGTKIGSFFIDILVDAASGNLSINQLIASIGKLEATSFAGAAGLTKIAQAVANFGKKTMNNAFGLTKLQGMTDISATKFERWGRAAAYVGVSSNTVAQAMMGVQDVMAKVFMTGEPPKVFYQLGISATNAKGKLKDFEEIMKDLSKNEVFWRAGAGVQRELLPQFGLPQEMLVILKEIRAGTWQSKINLAPGLSEKQIEDLGTLKSEFLTLGNMAEQIGINMVLGGGVFKDYLINDIQPILQWILDVQSGKYSGKEILGTVLGVDTALKDRGLVGGGITPSDIQTNLVQTIGESLAKLFVQEQKQYMKLDIMLKDPRGNQIGGGVYDVNTHQVIRDLRLGSLEFQAQESGPRQVTP